MQIFHWRAVEFYLALAVFAVNAVPASAAEEVFEAWQLKRQTNRMVEQQPQLIAQ